MSVYAFDSHVISCVFSDVLEAVTGVTWSLTGDGITPAFEDHDGDANTQEHTLTIDADALVGIAGPTPTTVTCSKTFGSEAPVTAEQALTVSNPSEFMLL